MEFNSPRRPARGGAAPTSPSQKHEGWILVGDRYDDGGFSGGSMERPALQRLLRDVESGVIDVIVVYKVDRLSAARSPTSQGLSKYSTSTTSRS